MKKIFVGSLLLLMSAGVFAKYTLDIPMFAFYDFNYALYKNNPDRTISSAGFGIGTDWFFDDSIVGLYVRTGLGFPLSVKMDNMQVFNRNSVDFGLLSKSAFGPVVKIEPLRLLSINLALAVGLETISFASFDVSNPEAVSGFLMNVPIILDAAIKIRPAKSFFIAVGVTAQYSIPIIQLEANSQSGFVLETPQQLGVTPYLGIGLTLIRQ